MAIFKKKSEKTTEVAPAKESTTSTPVIANASVIRPHITEKAGMKSEKGAYTFEVAKKATKFSIAKAVKELYKVTPVKVNIVNLPSKKVFAKGKKGTKKGVRKAYVYLKEGDKIEFV